MTQKPIDEMTPEEYSKYQAQKVREEHSKMQPVTPEQFMAQCERLKRERQN
jgi:hypothetical protein